MNSVTNDFIQLLFIIWTSKCFFSQTGIDDGYDIEREMLEGMYQRIKAQEFRPGHDHVTQVLKVKTLYKHTHVIISWIIH